MIEYLLLTLPSALAGGLGFAWHRTKAENKRLRESNVALRVAVKQAVTEPQAFQNRVGRVGSRLAGREERIALIREQRKAARAERKGS